MPVIVTILILIALLFGRPAWAQGNDALNGTEGATGASRGAYGQPGAGMRAVKISPNQIGVIASNYDAVGGLEKFFSERSYSIEERLPGGVFIVRLPKNIERGELLQLARDLVAQNSNLIRKAGIVATLPGSTRPVIVLEEIIVRFRSETPPDVIKKVADDNNLTPTNYEILNAEQRKLDRKEVKAPANQILFRAKPGSTIDALRISEALSRMKDVVEFAHPNFVLPLELRQIPQPSDDQWHHRNMGQDNGTVGADARTYDAWRITQGGTGQVVIAVIEFGFDAAHPSLASQSMSWDFVTNSLPLETNDSMEVRHGTAMAGLAAGAANTVGILGACPRCKLMLLRVSPDAGMIEQAIRYARANGAAIITNSWGIPQGATMPASLEAAIEDAASGSVVLFAMDNGFVPDCKDHPTGLSSVIAVSRSTNRDLADSAGYGNCLSLLAPSAWSDTVPSRGTRWVATTDTVGEKGYNKSAVVPALCPELPQTDAVNFDYTRCVTGTSASTALVAGVAGLVLSASPSTTQDQVKMLLQDTADKIEPWAAGYRLGDGRSRPGETAISTHGFGRVNALEALSIVAPVSNPDGAPGQGGVDVFLRDSALDWGNTSSSTRTGAPPNPRGNVQSVDIKLDPFPYESAPTQADFDSFPDNPTPSAEGNRVYVRVHNRGPSFAPPVTVKLFATLFDKTLPPLPANWNAPQGTGVDGTWQAYPCDAPQGPACTVDVGYSGASVGGTLDDHSQIVMFELPAITDWDGVHKRLSLLATVHAVGTTYNDPVPAIAGVAEDLAPASNNVTYRNYPEDTVEERGACSTLPYKNWVTTNTPEEIRWAIADTLGSYSWALDDKRAEDFEALFAASGTYEVCSGGGDPRVYNAASNEIRHLLEDRFAKLAKIQTRHILSNTLLHAHLGKSGNVVSVDSRTTMFVTMQHNDADRAVPNPDYTAEVRATLVPEGGKWKFRSLTVYTDSPQFVLRGR